MISDDEYELLVKEADRVCMRNNLAYSNNEFNRRGRDVVSDNEKTIVVLTPIEIRRLGKIMPKILMRHNYKIDGLMDGVPVVKLPFYNGMILIPTPMTKINASDLYWCYDINNDALTAEVRTTKIELKYIKLKG